MSYSPSLIRAIALRHGLSGEVSPLPAGGMVNEAWAIGDDHILRIVMEGSDPACDGEAVRETAVVALVRRAGIKTPRLVASDTTQTFAPRPYTVYERAPGETIGFSRLQLADWDKAWRQLGAELATLHSIPVDEVVAPTLLPERAHDVSNWSLRATDAGVLTESQAQDLAMVARRVMEIGGSAEARCLTHCDIHPWNLMGSPSDGSLAAILDWGDATYGDPAADLASMPLESVPAILAGYRSAGGNASASFVARSIVIGLTTALWEACAPEMASFERSWWRMPRGGWEETRLFISQMLPGAV